MIFRHFQSFLLFSFIISNVILYCFPIQLIKYSYQHHDIDFDDIPFVGPCDSGRGAAGELTWHLPLALHSVAGVKR